MKYIKDFENKKIFLLGECIIKDLICSLSEEELTWAIYSENVLKKEEGVVNLLKNTSTGFYPPPYQPMTSPYIYPGEPPYKVTCHNSNLSEDPFKLNSYLNKY